jgi:hypothetical protein
LNFENQAWVVAERSELGERRTDFKRGVRGVYQHCSEKHLHRYLAEFDFRYNNRAALGTNDLMRAGNLASSIVGKRLTYRRPHQVQL